MPRRDGTPDLPPTFGTRTPLHAVCAGRGALALLATVLNPAVAADLRAAALLARVLVPAVAADLRAAALLAIALVPAVAAYGRPPTLLAQPTRSPVFAQGSLNDPRPLQSSARRSQWAIALTVNLTIVTLAALAALAASVAPDAGASRPK